MQRINVSLLAVDEVDSSSLSGLYTVLNLYRNVLPDTLAYHARIVAPDDAAPDGLVHTMPGLPIPVQCRIGESPDTDVVVIPSLFPDAHGEWHPGRHPQAVDWLRRLYHDGKMVCSSCTGALLLAETGLLDGREATQHWAFSATFRRHFPNVRLNDAKVLVVTGDGNRLVMSGASAAWHDLVLYLVARTAGPAAARTIARFFLLQWHSEGQAPYIVFRENLCHGDSVIVSAQEWLREHCRESSPVESVTARAGISARSFNRRFRKATGLTPIAYVQHLRVEAAKQRLETTRETVDVVGQAAGYEDPAFFRRVFKRITGLSPSEYRRKFKVIGIVDEGTDASGWSQAG